MKASVIQSSRALRSVVLLGSATLVAFATGCSDTSAPAISSDPVVSIEDTVPPMSELTVEADLTEAQARALEPALAEWRSAMAKSEASEDFLLEDSPAIEFLAQAAGVVDRNQLSTVVRLAQRSVEARDVSLQPDPGDRRANLHRGIKGLFRDLDLTDEQIALIRAALATSHEEAEALCDDFKDGVITEEELLAGRVEIREALDETIASVLTDKQNEQLEQNKIEVMERRLTRMLERFDARVERRVKRLDALLELTDDQEAAVSTVLAGAKPDIEALLVSVEAGTVSSEDARDQFHAIREEVREAVRAELTAEQVEILDALRDMNVPCGRTLHD